MILFIHELPKKCNAEQIKWKKNRERERDGKTD